MTQVLTDYFGPINLTIESNKTIGISGPSGSGKSLLLRTIADLDPHQGEIVLNNISQSDLPPSQWRSRVAYIAAESSWWEPTIGAHFAEDDREPLLFWLEQAGFKEETLNWEVHKLSTGERQRLSIIRHLLRKPAVLLLDEPTASLDPENVTRMEQLLHHYRQQQQATLIWVSHDRSQLERLCDQHFQLHQGQLEAVNHD